MNSNVQIKKHEIITFKMERYEIWNYKRIVYETMKRKKGIGLGIHVRYDSQKIDNESILDVYNTITLSNLCMTNTNRLRNGKNIFEKSIY